MIYLDGLGLLHQWDIGREVVCDAACDQVHFAQSGSRGGALVVEARPGGDGEARAEVPNCLLVSGSSVDVWAVSDGVVTDSKRLPVLDRPKPDDYAYTPTEVLTISSMREWVESRIEDLGVSPTDYRNLENLPSIAGAVLLGDKSLEDLGIVPATDEDIDGLFEGRSPHGAHGSKWTNKEAANG